MSNISIKGLNKADVLAALYNASKPQGMGFMHYDPTPMTRQQAQEILDQQGQYFDYLKGRVMKLDLSGDEINTWGYDRDNGDGAVEKVIELLRETGDLNGEYIQETHANNTFAAGVEVQEHLDEETRLDGRTLTLGLADVKEHIGPAVEKIIGVEIG